MRTEKGGLAQDHDARDAHAGMGIEATIVPAWPAGRAATAWKFLVSMIYFAWVLVGAQGH